MFEIYSKELDIHSEFVSSSDPQWQEVREVEGYDFYHLPEYAKLDASLVGGTPICWTAETRNNKTWIPLIERRIPDSISKSKNYVDYSSPYGYPGILFSSPVSHEQLNSIIRQFQADGADSGNCVTSFLRLNPILNPFVWQKDDLIEQADHGHTITVPLDEDLEEIENNFYSSYRRAIKKLLDEGFTFILNDRSRLDDFLAIYKDTMDRLEASDYYYFPETYFEQLFDMMGDKAYLSCVTDKNNEMAAAGIFTDFNGVIQSHLAATSTTHLEHSPSKLLYYGLIEWATANSNHKWLHLGGGLNSKEDSLYKFKRGFSPIENQFSTLRIIHDKQAYNNLNYNALVEAGREEFEDPDYFPLYRQG